MELILASKSSGLGLFAAYRQGPRFDVVVNLLTEQAFSKRRLTVFGGDQIRPHIHIADMCSVYSFCLKGHICQAFLTLPLKI